MNFGTDYTDRFNTIYIIFSDKPTILKKTSYLHLGRMGLHLEPEEIDSYVYRKRANFDLLAL